jgi:hypothetical protein
MALSVSTPWETLAVKSKGFALPSLCTCGEQLSRYVFHMFRTWVRRSSSNSSNSSSGSGSKSRYSSRNHSSKCAYWAWDMESLGASPCAVVDCCLHGSLANISSMAKHTKTNVGV